MRGGVPRTKETIMKHKARLLFVVALSLALVAQAVTADKAQQKSLNRPASVDTRLAEFEKTLDTIRQDLKIPALSAAIVKDQKVVWARGFGYADVENKIPATEHTAYHLASLTKTFASTILMQLVQEGKIKLDDPVSKYGITLESDGVIRVRHLLSHTSEGNPGEQYRYNGNRFAELDKVVERATGKSFAEVLIANILDPLGMNETAPNVPTIVGTKSPNTAAQAAETEVKAAVYGDSAVTTFFAATTITPPNGPVRTEGPWRSSIFWNKQDGAWKLVHSHQSPLGRAMITEKHQQRFDTVSKILAQPYALDREFKFTKITYPQGFSTSAGLISTVLDMAKYDIAIDQNKFLTKETQQLAFTPAVSTRGESLPYGLGWFTTNYKGTKLVWHYGYWTGNSSFILKVPEQNITFIIMANSDNLSRPTDLGSGNALSSPVGMAFLKTFIFPEKFGESVPEISWDTPAAELKT